MAAKKSGSKSAGNDKPVESKADAFKRLAVKRVNKAAKTISLVGNLSTYPHSPENAQRVIDALNEAVYAVQQRFSTTKAATKDTFTL
jgi:hypothetical protein